MGTQGVLCPACGAVAEFDARECPNCLTSLSPSMDRTQVRASPKPKPLDGPGATLLREEAPGRTLDDDSQSTATRRMPALPSRRPGHVPPTAPVPAQTLVADDAPSLEQTALGEDSDPDLGSRTDPRAPTPRLDASEAPASPRRTTSGTMAMPARGQAPARLGAEGPELSQRRDALLGQKLGEYVVEERIGIGGMSTVYRARQPRIGKDVAVKVLRSDVISDARDMEQLLNEARTVNAIHHPGIINIFDAGELPDGRQYLVMEHLDGESLEERMEREPRLTLAEALPILEDTMAALSAAHNAGVVHRDLKPANVFLVKQPEGKPWVKLLDFGLARPTARREVSRVAGTPDYISPEHARGRPPGPPADVYALGVLAFQLATGRLPFLGTNAHEVMEKHVKVAPPVPKSIDPRIPDPLSALILKMLDKEPGRRPESAQVRTELRNIARLVGAISDSDVGRALPPAAPAAAPDPAPEGPPRTQPLGLAPMPTPPPHHATPHPHPGPAALRAVPETTQPSGPPMLVPIPRATMPLDPGTGDVTRKAPRRSLLPLLLLVLAFLALAAALLLGPELLQQLQSEAPRESGPPRSLQRLMQPVGEDPRRSRFPDAPDLRPLPAPPAVPTPPVVPGAAEDAGVAGDAGAAPDGGGPADAGLETDAGDGAPPPPG